MTEECEHKNLRLSCWESTAQDFDATKKGESGWDGEQEPIGVYHLESGHCRDCDKELTPQELAKLTGLTVYKAKFTEV